MNINSVLSLAPRFALGAASVGAVAAVLAPWARNREYLNDFLDYGLMMAAAGRIESGEKPFVDFITPLQTSSILANTAAERIFGGTYQAMTMGNGVLIVVTFFALVTMLRKKLPQHSAIALTAVVVVGSLAQHTIIWYNALGVITLALVSWSTAVAPVLQSRQWGWHLITIVGFLIGGTNKLNFHFVALAVALAWAIRQGINSTQEWKKVALTALVWGVSAIVLPVAWELAWTGATWEEWHHNVIVLATNDRSGMVAELFTLRFYLHPMHNHYGQTLGSAGAITAAWLAFSVVNGWRSRSGPDRILLLGAAILAMASTAGILATNIDIVYIAMSSGIVLVTALWLGFDLGKSTKSLHALLVVPAILLGIVMWYSAWLGQRSQFGHYSADRSTYQTAESADGRFDYLKNTRMPPMFATGLLELQQLIPEQENTSEHPHFYATGAEWLERIWPAVNPPQLPLWMAGLTYGASEIERLKTIVSSNLVYRKLIVVESWLGTADQIFQFPAHTSPPQIFGVFSVQELHSGSLVNGILPHGDGLLAMQRLGGNMDPIVYEFADDLWEFTTDDGVPYMGITRGRGSFKFARTSTRVSGNLVLNRTGDRLEPPLEASFRIVDPTTEEFRPYHTIWSQTVIIPEGANEVIVPYAIDTRGQKTQFIVEIPVASEEQLSAGWMMPRINYSGHITAIAPKMRWPVLPEFNLDEAQRKSLLPAPWDGPATVTVRGGSLQEGMIRIPNHGEIWIRPMAPLKQLYFHVRSMRGAPGQEPTIRMVWYKGGRVEVIHQEPIQTSLDSKIYNLWPIEDDGWYGLMVDGSIHDHEVEVSVTIEESE